MSKDFNEAVDVLFHKVDDLVSTKTVVGDAIVVGDMTLLPLIDVAVGSRGRRKGKCQCGRQAWAQELPPPRF